MRHLSSRRSVINGALLSAVALLAAPIGAQSQTASGKTLILGAGSTFAAPLYSAWIKAFTKDKPDLSINYDAVGSGEGISRFITGSVDFAGTDAPLSDDELGKVENGALQIPSTAGMIVLAYQLSGFSGELRLPRDLYPEILAGNVTHWDDPRLQAANPDAKLPHRTISVVARLDSSGTTYALTRHLGAISDNWRESGPGVGKLVSWERAMLGRGNEGVAQKIKISDGVIGYVEYGFAARLGLPMATLENKAGRFVHPTEAAGRATIAAAAGDDVPDDVAVYLADPKGDQSYPIITLSWLLVNERYRDPARSAAIKNFINWGLTDGQSFSIDLGYLPLPASFIPRAQQTVERVS
jgi:phosphate transport system substrate-binding protein